jgi:hypothetical protein
MACAAGTKGLVSYDPHTRHCAIFLAKALMIHSKSWLSPLPDTTYEVKALLKEHDRRVKRNEYNPASGLLPTQSRQPTGLTVQPAIAVTSLGLGEGLATFLKNKRPKLSNKNDRPTKKSREEQGTVYSGVVRLLQTTVPKFQGNLAVYCNTTSTPPMYQCFVTVADASGISLPVLVSGPVGERLFGIPAQHAASNTHQREVPFDTNVAWKVSILSVWKGSKKFFVLKDVERVTPE